MKNILVLLSLLLFPLRVVYDTTGQSTRWDLSTFSLYAQDWHWQNPLPQGNTLNDVEFLDANTIVAVGDNGTVVRSSDAGANWSVQHSLGGGILNSLSGISFVDANTGFAVGYYGTVLRTTDSGVTWQAYAGPFSSLYDVSFADVNTGTVVGEGGTVARTTDGGLSWTAQTSGTTEALLGVSFADDQVGIAVGWNGTILRTTNGGLTWIQQSSGSGGYLWDAHLIDANVGVVVGFDGIILRTADGGTTWTQQWSGDIHHFIDVSFIDEDRGAIVANDGIVISTTNGGLTWTEYYPGESFGLAGISLADENHWIVVGAYGQVIHTSDAGTTWQDMTTAITRYSVNDVSIPNPYVATAVGDDGIFRTTDAGASWFRQTNPSQQGLLGVRFVDISNGFAVGYSGTILRTTNGGESWIEQSSGIRDHLFDVSFVDANTGIAVGSNYNNYRGIILRTTNGGSKWIPSYLGSLALSGVSFVDASNGWVVGDLGTILHTSDGGVTWTEQSSGTTNWLTKVSFTDTSNGTAVGGLTILHTTNGGNEWTSQGSPAFGSLFDVSFSDANNGTAVGQSGMIIHTTNGGSTWIAELSPTQYDLWGVSHFDDTTVTAVGGGGAIIRTGGASPPGLWVDISIDSTWLPIPAEGDTIPIDLTFTNHTSDSAKTNMVLEIRFPDGRIRPLATKRIPLAPSQVTSRSELLRIGGDFPPGVYVLEVYWDNRAWSDQFSFVKLSTTPSVAFSPASMQFTMDPDQVNSASMTISNNGSVDLTFSLSDGDASLMMLAKKNAARSGLKAETHALPKGAKDFRHGEPPVEGMGGPDGFGNYWIDSDEPGGPEFSWIDITSVGTPLEMSDDDNQGPFPLGIDFHYYGSTYSSVRICSNGFVSFTSTSGDFGNVPIPSAGDPNNALFGFWDDLYPPGGGTVHYYTDEANSRFIVQWTAVPHYDTGGPYTFQIILQPNEVLYQYLSMGSPTNDATIGIENAGGYDGLLVVFNADYVHDNLAVRTVVSTAAGGGSVWLSENPTQGTVPAGGSVEVEIIAGSAGLTAGTYNANVVISSNDPFHPDTTMPVSLTVLGVLGGCDGSGVPGEPGEPLMSLVHTPGNLNVGIFNDGSIGTDNQTYTGPGVTWRGVNGCFVGGPIFGTAARGCVNGLIGSFSVFGDIINDTSNFDGGFTSDVNFDQIASADLDDSGAPIPYGVAILQRSYTNTGEEHGFVRYGFVNTSGATLDDFYAGIFIDWDIFEYITNSGGYDVGRDLVYNWDADGTTYYYGLAALDGLSGARTTTSTPAPEVRSGSFTWITTFDFTILANGDFRTWIGTGPLSISPGDTAWATFAVLAGDDLAGLQANADGARAKAIEVGWIPAGEFTGLSKEGGLPKSFDLAQNFPNPFNPSTRINYALPEQAVVSLKVYNLLGQELTSLSAGVQEAGYYEVTWSGRNGAGASVGSGVYFYRLEARGISGKNYVNLKKMLYLR